MGRGERGYERGGEDKKHEAEDKKVQSDEGFDPLGQVVREGVEVIKEMGEGDEQEGGDEISKSESVPTSDAFSLLILIWSLWL